MPSEVFSLYLLLQLKDFASGGLNRVEAQLRSMGKEGRQALKTFQDLRSDLKKDLGISAIGIGGLMLMRKGVQAAGDFEQAMTDLKVSIAEVGKDGAPNMAKLNDQMARFQSLGVQLGNSLPGSTQDFVQMFTTLKQGGMQTERILGGAGKAVANLAVVTHQNPAELAQEFAQFGEMFQLQTQEEWNKAADTFARIYRATGVTSSEMVQGLKFAQVRAGAPLGMGGIGGAEQLGRVLGVLRTFGLEGGFGGRELSRFLNQLATFEQNAAKLKKKFGIDLQKEGINLNFFDAKHQFVGFDSMFKQLEQLRKLAPKEREIVGEKIFTAEGVAIANAFMTAGEEGWKKINDRVDAVIPLEQQVAQITDTWNAKLENVEGTLKNLAAVSFTPMLDEIKPLADLLNAVVGSLVDFGTAHPAIAGLVTDFAGFALVAVTLTGAIRAGSTMWGLYTIASTAATRALQGEAVAAGTATAATLTGAEARKAAALAALGDASALQAEAVAAGEAAVATDAAALKVGGLGKGLGALGAMSPLKLTVAIGLIGANVEFLLWLFKETKKWNQEVAEQQRKAEESAARAAQANQILYTHPNIAGQKADLVTLQTALAGATDDKTKKGLQWQVDVLQKNIEQAEARRAQQEDVAKTTWESFSALKPDVGSGFWKWLGYDVDPRVRPGWAGATGPRGEASVLPELRGLGGGALMNVEMAARLINLAERGQLKGVGAREGTVFGAPGVTREESLGGFHELLKSMLGDQRYQEAMQLATKETAEFSKETEDLNPKLDLLKQKLGGSLPGAIDDAIRAFQDFKTEMSGWQPPAGSGGPTPTPTPSPTPGSEKTSFALPRIRETRASSGARVSVANHIRYAPVLQVGPGTDAREFEKMLYRHSTQLAEIISREVGTQRERV